MRLLCLYRSARAVISIYFDLKNFSLPDITVRCCGKGASSLRAHPWDSLPLPSFSVPTLILSESSHHRPRAENNRPQRSSRLNAAMEARARREKETTIATYNRSHEYFLCIFITVPAPPSQQHYNGDFDERALAISPRAAHRASLELDHIAPRLAAARLPVFSENDRAQARARECSPHGARAHER